MITKEFMDSSNVQAMIPLAGKTFTIVEEVPRGMIRVLTFGYLNCENGTARNFQMFVVDKQKRRFPISPNDSQSKSLEGNQVLKNMEHVEVTVAAGADNVELLGSVSYEDWAVRR